MLRGLTNAASQGAERNSHHTKAGLTSYSKLDIEIKIRLGRYTESFDSFGSLNSPAKQVPEGAA